MGAPFAYLFIFLIGILPYLAMAGVFFALIRWAYLSQHPTRPLWLYPLLGSFLLTAGFVLWMQHAIFTSRHSTAAIGWFFLPFYAAVVAGASLVLMGAFVYAGRFLLERLGAVNPRITSVAPLIIAVLVLLLSGRAAYQEYSRRRVLELAKTAPPSQAVVRQAAETQDLTMLAALARNPLTPEQQLRSIFASVKEKINSPYSQESEVLHALADNPKTPPELLKALARGATSSVRMAVAMNSNTPVDCLPGLAADPEKLVRTWVTTHPQISRELLEKLASDKDNVVRNYAQTALRRRAPAEAPQTEADGEMKAMQELGLRAAGGDLTAIDEIEAKRSELYKGIDYNKDRPRVIANLQLMRAAFDPLGKAAGKGGEAMKALVHANEIQGLRSFTVDAYGQAAGAGNADALEALLSYQAHGWLLSTTVSAMRYSAEANQPQAVDFLIAVLNDPNKKGLSFLASQGLKSAAAEGNEKAKAALAGAKERNR